MQALLVTNIIAALVVSISWHSSGSATFGESLVAAGVLLGLPFTLVIALPLLAVTWGGALANEMAITLLWLVAALIGCAVYSRLLLIALKKRTLAPRRRSGPRVGDGF